MKKRCIIPILVFSLLLGGLSACSVSKNGGFAEYDLKLLAEDIVESEAFSDILTEVSQDIAKSLYGYGAEDVIEGRLLCSTGATTEEIGLFKCRDKEAASRVLEKAEARIVTQGNIYESYAPEEIPKLNNAVCKAEGNYVFYIVSTDSKSVKQVLKSY